MIGASQRACQACGRFGSGSSRINLEESKQRPQITNRRDRRGAEFRGGSAGHPFVSPTMWAFADLRTSAIAAICNSAIFAPSLPQPDKLLAFQPTHIGSAADEWTERALKMTLTPGGPARCESLQKRHLPGMARE